MTPSLTPHSIPLSSQNHVPTVLPSVNLLKRTFLISKDALTSMIRYACMYSVTLTSREGVHFVMQATLETGSPKTYLIGAMYVDSINIVLCEC